MAAVSRLAELLREEHHYRRLVDGPLEVMLDEGVGLVLVTHDLHRLVELGL